MAINLSGTRDNPHPFILLRDSSEKLAIDSTIALSKKILQRLIVKDILF